MPLRQFCSNLHLTCSPGANATDVVQISSVVSGKPCDGILELGDEISFIGNESLEGMTLQDVKLLLASNQEDELTFIVKRGGALEY